MEADFTRARELDERYDWAGPDRNLGLLYRDAPAIGSVGSRSKARRHLKRAVELAPQYPENRLNLARGLPAMGRTQERAAGAAGPRTAWPGARTNLDRDGLGGQLGAIGSRG